MTSVHGIAVSGPTFPASIWRLFMERAVDYAPFPTEFPTPKTSPHWTYHNLQYALSGAYSTSSSSSSGTYTPPAQSTTTTAARPAPQPTPPPPAPTPQPPPVTTTEPAPPPPPPPGEGGP
jgi:hypothetical protein